MLGSSAFREYGEYPPGWHSETDEKFLYLRKLRETVPVDAGYDIVDEPGAREQFQKRDGSFEDAGSITQPVMVFF